MPMYQKKQETVRAIQLTRKDFLEITRKAKAGEELSEDEELLNKVRHQPHVGYSVMTHAGKKIISPGDFLIKTSAGNIQVKNSTEFSKHFELPEKKETDREPSKVDENPSAPKKYC